MDKKERTKVVVDETTIYEIDLDCMECKKDGSKKKGEDNVKTSVKQNHS